MSLPIRIHMNSLGCAKNLVNAEQMLALLRQEGMEIVEDPSLADAAIINTCGFIDAAKQEAIDAILETAALKEQGSLKALVATGCLVERYQDEIMAELPELDAVCGAGSYTDIVQAVRQALAGKKAAFFQPAAQAALEGSRRLLTPAYSVLCRRLASWRKRARRSCWWWLRTPPDTARISMAAALCQSCWSSFAKFLGWNGYGCTTCIQTNWTTVCWT